MVIGIAATAASIAQERPSVPLPHGAQHDDPPVPADDDGPLLLRPSFSEAAGPAARGISPASRIAAATAAVAPVSAAPPAVTRRLGAPAVGTGKAAAGKRAARHRPIRRKKAPPAVPQQAVESGIADPAREAGEG